jgi:hypothetical protein
MDANFILYLLNKRKQTTLANHFAVKKTSLIALPHIDEVVSHVQK